MSQNNVRNEESGPTVELDSSQPSDNIRRRLGNWTANPAGATMPIANATRPIAPQAVSAPTAPFVSPSAPSPVEPEQTVRFVNSPSGPLDPTMAATMPFKGASLVTTPIAAPAGSALPTAPFPARQPAGSPTVPFIGQSTDTSQTVGLNDQAPAQPQTVAIAQTAVTAPWGQAGQAQTAAIPQTAVTAPWLQPGQSQTVPMAQNARTANWSHAPGAETMPMAGDVTAPIVRPSATSQMAADGPGDYTMALTGGRPTAEFELEREIAGLRDRCQSHPYDPDLHLELALALNEAGNRVEAEATMRRILQMYEGAGDRENAQRIRAMLGSADTQAMPNATDATTRMASPNTDSFKPRTGTLSLKTTNARDGRVPVKSKVDEREAPVFAARDVVFVEELPNLDRLTAEGQAFWTVAEQERLAGRYRSAMDSLQQAIASDPGVAPLFVRLAELQLKLGYRKKAQTTINDLQRSESVFRSGVPDWIFARLRIHAEPFDLTKVKRLVDHLVSEHHGEDAAPYAARLIDQLAGTNRVEEAREYANRMCVMAPGNTQIALEAALLELSNGDSSKAIERWEFALRNGADPAVARTAMAAIVVEVAERNHWKLLADVLPVYRNTKQAMIATAYQRTATVMGLTANHRAALSLFVQGAPDSDARAALALAAGDRTGSPVGRAAAAAVLARALQQSDRGDEYLSAIRTTLALINDERIPAETNWIGLLGFDPNIVDLSFELGQELIRAGDHAGAVDVLRQGYALDKTHVQLNQALADALARTNQLGSALTILDELAMGYRKVGKLEEMATVLRQMSQLAPSNIKVKSRLVDAYLQRGFVAEARAELIQRADLEERANLIREAIVSLQRAADLSWNLGYPQEAFNLYDRVLSLDPEDVGNRSALVNLYLQVGRLSDAAEHQRAVVDLALKHGRKHEAVAALHQVIGLTPDDMTAYYQLGEQLASMGEYHQAEKVYRRVVLMNPDDAIANAKATAMAALREQMTGEAAS